MTWEPGSEDRDRAVDFLNSKVIAIAAGTNEMQRNGISERILGMPRELSVDTRRPTARWSGRRKAGRRRRFNLAAAR